MAKKIGEILVERGLLTTGLVERGLESQRFYGGRFGSLMVEMGALEEKALVEALCEQKSAKPAKASMLKSVAKSTLDLIPVKIATRYQVVRGSTADFMAGCTMFGPFVQTFLVDAAPVASGEIRYYMNRSFHPNLGSWGQDSAAVERSVPCD